MGGRAHRGRQVRGMSLTRMMGYPESPRPCCRNSGSSGGVSCPVTWDNRFPHITGPTFLSPCLPIALSVCAALQNTEVGYLWGHWGTGDLGRERNPRREQAWLSLAPACSCCETSDRPHYILWWFE